MRVPGKTLFPCKKQVPAVLRHSGSSLFERAPLSPRGECPARRGRPGGVTSRGFGKTRSLGRPRDGGAGPAAPRCFVSPGAGAGAGVRGGVERSRAAAGGGGGGGRLAAPPSFAAAHHGAATGAEADIRSAADQRGGPAERGPQNREFARARLAHPCGCGRCCCSCGALCSASRGGCAPSQGRQRGSRQRARSLGSAGSNAARCYPRQIRGSAGEGRFPAAGHRSKTFRLLHCRIPGGCSGRSNYLGNSSFRLATRELRAARSLERRSCDAGAGGFAFCSRQVLATGLKIALQLGGICQGQLLQ
jgi:hypothetical protein